MSVYKRADKWYIDYYLPGGKRIREAAGSSKKLAEKLLAKRQAEVLEGKFNIEKPDYILFEEMVEKFLEYAQSNVKPTTRKRYEVSVRQLEGYFKGKMMHTVTAYEIEQYKQERIKTVTPATVNRDLAFLRRMINQAKKWGMITKNPLDEVGFYREDNIRTRYLTLEEINLLLEECKKNPPLYLAVWVALHTGMRKQEILSLKIPGNGTELDKINWVDIDSRYFHLNVTKTGKHRKVPINEALYPLIIEAVEKAKDQNLFPVKDIRKGFENSMRRTGIRNATFHDLRRTFISHAMMAGYSQEVIQKVVGQDDPSIFKRYAHLSPDMQKQVVNDVGKLFTGHKSDTSEIGNFAKSR